MALILLSGNVQRSIGVSFVDHFAEMHQVPVLRYGGVEQLSIGVFHLQQLQLHPSLIATGGSVLEFLKVSGNFQIFSVSLFFFLYQVFRRPPDFAFVQKRIFSF